MADRMTFDSLKVAAIQARARTHAPEALPQMPGRGNLLQEMGGEPDPLFELFDLPAAVQEWVELVERKSGQGDMARLLFALEAFVDKVYPEVRQTAQGGQEGSWWPAVHTASKLGHIGRKLGMTQPRRGHRYTGRFDASLFKRMLQKVRSEASHAALRSVADEALAAAPA